MKSLAVATVVAALQLCACDVNTKSDLSNYLVNLKKDPYEKKNYYSKSSYKSKKTAIAKRSKYWKKKVVQPDSINEVKRNKAFKKCGGVCSYIDDEVAPPFEVPREKKSSSSAPNIVFVLVDDWGYNDAGFQSTYLSWTTPTIDRLAAEGITLDNYYTAYVCQPARSSLLTGRYALRQGTWNNLVESELPTDESTIAQELQSAGYETYMVGKWHLGYTSSSKKPLARGFDKFYGFLTGKTDYWTHMYQDTYLDLQDGDDLVTDEEELATHNSYLFEQKAEYFLKYHSEKYGSSKPMFLYYSMQMVHSPVSAPDIYRSRCHVPTGVDDDATDDTRWNYCGLNVMLDEAVGNLTCALETYGFSDNTVLILASDNGGDSTAVGSSYPYKGSKGAAWNGGVKATAFIHSPLISSKRQGKTYSGLMHVTDWFPTIMNIATDGDWDGTPLSGYDLDGVDMWDAINDNDDSPRSEIVHYHDGKSSSVIQVDDYKLFLEVEDAPTYEPLYKFDKDMDSSSASFECSNPSLMSESYVSRTYTRLLASLGVPPGESSSYVRTFHIYGLGVVFLSAGAMLTIHFARQKQRGEKA